jgi:hypothetical protein
MYGVPPAQRSGVIRESLQKMPRAGEHVGSSLVLDDQEGPSQKYIITLDAKGRESHYYQMVNWKCCMSSSQPFQS